VNHQIQTILVPKGAEHQAVCKGLQGVFYPPAVFPIPVGSTPLLQFLEELHQSGCLDAGQQVLVLGLCGSLVPSLEVGDVVLYQGCISAQSGQPAVGDFSLLTRDLQTQLAGVWQNLSLVTVATSDRVISTPAEKHQLAQKFGAQVVDMEGYPMAEFLAKLGVSVAMLRVVSDDCHHAIPNLADAFSPEGNLNPVRLAIAFIRQPIAAIRLIRGSLQGLATLTTLTQTLFANSD
jgi:Phosphorylase superfamily